VLHRRICRQTSHIEKVYSKDLSVSIDLINYPSACAPKARKHYWAYIV
jgi:hypothetical protein